MSSIAVAVLVGGLWTGAYELWLRQDFIRMNEENTGRILERIRVSDQEEQLGLVEALLDSEKYDYSDLILNSPSLTLLLNDGRTWVSLHNEKLQKRFADSTKTTKVFLLDPESEMVTVMARKTGTSPDALKAKLQETVDMLATASTQHTKLEVCGHSLFNPFALFLGDNYGVITLYFAARGRKAVPLFTFEERMGDCLFKRLRDDVGALRLDARDLKPSALGRHPCG